MESDVSSGLSGAMVAPAGARSIPAQAERAARLSAWLERALSAERPRDYRRVFWVVTGVIVSLGSLVVLHGPCLQVNYGHDNIGFLAAAWKVRCGIWPHTDYHSALGALNPWVYAAGMFLLGPTATVIPFCNALVAVGLGWLAWAVASRRLPALLAGIFAFTQATVAMTPHLLRFDWFAATYDGYYNRQGYALLVTLMLLLFLPPPDREDTRASRRDERFAGVILGVLLFLKVSYFVTGVGLGVTAFVLGKRFARRVPWHLLAAFGIMVLLCLPLIRFDLAAMFGDLRMAGSARAGNPAAALTVGRYLGWLPDAWLEVVLLAAAQAVLRPPWLIRQEARAGVPTWAEFVAVVGASMFLGLTNSPGGSHSETPLLTSWIFVLVASLLRKVEVGERLEKVCLPFVCGVACVLWGHTFSNGLRCLWWSASPWPTRWQQAALDHEAPRFDSDSLASLRVLGAGGEPDERVIYADKVNDGLRLLRALGGTHRVEALDFADPFPFALQWPASCGGLWCWHNGYSFSLSAHPSPEEAFGDADVLMIPKHPGELASFRAMRELYAPFVRAHFKVTTESDQWILLQRL